jgi:hypothetical protein
VPWNPDVGSRIDATDASGSAPGPSTPPAASARTRPGTRARRRSRPCRRSVCVRSAAPSRSECGSTRRRRGACPPSPGRRSRTRARRHRWSGARRREHVGPGREHRHQVVAALARRDAQDHRPAAQVEPRHRVQRVAFGLTTEVNDAPGNARRCMSMFACATPLPVGGAYRRTSRETSRNASVTISCVWSVSASAGREPYRLTPTSPLSPRGRRDGCRAARQARRNAAPSRRTGRRPDQTPASMRAASPSIRAPIASIRAPR